MMKTQSYLSPQMPWLLETRLFENVDLRSVELAVQEWHGHGRRKNWLIDCSWADGFNYLELLQGADLLSQCNELERIALVASEEAKVAGPMIEQKTNIVVRHFTTRDEALRWYRRGCKE